MLDAYEAERRFSGRESSVTRLNAPPSLTRYSPSPTQTSPPLKAPMTTPPKRDADEDFASMFDCDGSPGALLMPFNRLIMNFQTTLNETSSARALAFGTWCAVSIADLHWRNSSCAVQLRTYY